MTINELKYYKKLHQKKFRELENKFLIEGAHLVDECLRSEIYSRHIEVVILRKDFKLGTNLENKLNTLRIKSVILDAPRFEQLSETVSSQGIMAVVSIPHQNEIDLNSTKWIVALDNIRDPGNAGTIFRTCYWFGIYNVILSSDSVDLYNPKLIRASQGAVFHIRINENADLENTLKELHRSGSKILLADIEADRTVNETGYSKDSRYTFVFGNEGDGISERILNNENFDRVKISSFSGCESLNVSVAAGIILYDACNRNT
ncbi:MAG: RNA methyltransferase [bacterium]|nr:RNA methyltransferase [bacterium]